jgi:hypothetical protein
MKFRFVDAGFLRQGFGGLGSFAACLFGGKKP